MKQSYLEMYRCIRMRDAFYLDQRGRGLQLINETERKAFLAALTSFDTRNCYLSGWVNDQRHETWANWSFDNSWRASGIPF